MKTAVVYLRVSTVGQVKTDYDPEGISIPAQRDACQRKAQQMGVEVIGEYVEPGRSATTMEKRPVFQEMLDRFKTERDVDYVIVYNLSRLNRNRVDDVKVIVALRSFGVTLVSAQENIDETPAGQLMHGILAAINEYRSSSDGADIRYKMGQKIKNGGSVGRAKLGYLNVRDTSEGREIRTVAIDPERAPYVQLAFELYATGDYTLKTLSAELAERGLRTRGSGRWPSGPISMSKLAVVLRDPYYTGVVTYQGEQYSGRHKPLITRELFERVQVVIDAHATAVERDRRHHHYLKGTLWCGVCHDSGQESRLILQRTVGRRGGEYWYYFCRARQDGGCTSPHQRVEAIEDAIVRHYAHVRLPEGVAEALRHLLDATLADEERTQRALAAEHAARLRQLDTAEENLLDLAAEGKLPNAKIRARLATIAEQRARLSEASKDSAEKLTAGAAVLRQALDLIDDIQEFYLQSSDEGRRMINQAFFKKLYAYEGVVTAEQFAEPFDALMGLREPPARYQRRRVPAHASGAPKGAAWRSRTSTDLLAAALMDGGSSKAVMVELPGIEPGSFGVGPGLLRAQSACRLSQPQCSRRQVTDRLSRCDCPHQIPRPGLTSKPPR